MVFERTDRNYWRQRVVFDAGIREARRVRDIDAVGGAIGEFCGGDAGRQVGRVPVAARAGTSTVTVGAEFSGEYMGDEIARGGTDRLAERSGIAERGAQAARFRHPG